MMRMKIYFVVAFIFAFSTSRGFAETNEWGGANPSPNTAKKGTAIISGKVILNGKAPAGDPIDFRSDPVCSSQHPEVVLDQTVQVNDSNNLINVLVYVKEGAGKFQPPSKAVTLTQKGCQFIPRVFGIQTNQTLEIVNKDGTFHTVHALAFLNDAFNLTEPTQGMKIKKTFTQPEVPVRFKCDVHYWMHCFAGIFSHPFFAVTSAEGIYKITDLPAGQYTLAAFQEKFGESAPQWVVLKEGETKTVNFIFTAP